MLECLKICTKPIIYANVIPSFFVIIYSNKQQPWYLLPASVTVAALGGVLFGYDIGNISFFVELF